MRDRQQVNLLEVEGIFSDEEKMMMMIMRRRSEVQVR